MIEAVKGQILTSLLACFMQFLVFFNKNIFLSINLCIFVHETLNEKKSPESFYVKTRK